ncbi:MAG: SCO1664 family protein [Actinomycetes bacterium]
MEAQDILAIVSENDLEIEGRLVDASNATLLASVSEGEDSLRVIYKPIAGERPLWDFPDGNLASREVAAYRLSALSGMDVVPLTILRDGPFGPGAVQLWIEVDPEVDVIAAVQLGDERLRMMALFDAVVNNTDRKFGHILFMPTGEVFGCDHGVTFHEEDKLRTVLWNWAGDAFSESEFAILRQIENQIVSWNLEELISFAELEATKGRVRELLLKGTFPVPNDNWPAVPWPPY